MPGPHGDQHLGVGGLEALEHVGQQVGADGQGGRDADRAPGRRLHVVHGLPGPGHRLQQLLGVGPQGPPGRGQGQAARAPLEQPHAQRALQGLDPGAHRRLGEPEGVGGPPEAPVGPHGQEGLDPGKVHGAEGITDVYRADKNNKVDCSGTAGHTAPSAAGPAPGRTTMSGRCECGTPHEDRTPTGGCQECGTRVCPSCALRVDTATCCRWCAPLVAAVA